MSWRSDNTPVYSLPVGVSASVHGHTVLEHPASPTMPDGSRVWLIDLGAVFRGGLCCLDCETWQTVVVR